jgi:hypothetical protein
MWKNADSCSMDFMRRRVLIVVYYVGKLTIGPYCLSKIYSKIGEENRIYVYKFV